MEDQTKKQNFLRTAILEKGYDPVQFTEYLEEERPNGNKSHYQGTDIDNWSFSSLEESVNKFIRTHPLQENSEGKILVRPEENLSDDEDELKVKDTAGLAAPGLKPKGEDLYPEERKRIATEIMHQSDEEKIAMNVLLSDSGFYAQSHTF